MNSTSTLTTLLRTQDGLVTRDQVLRLGWSTSAIDRRLASGDWLRVHPRVYRAADHRWTPRVRTRAFGLWLPDSATITGGTAAHWWDLTDDVPPVLRAALPPPGRRAAPPDTVLSRRWLAPEDRVKVDGLWCACRSLAVLEASVELGLLGGARLMDRSLQQGRVTLDGLQGALDRTAGRAGTELGRRLLELAAGGARSEAERMAGAGLRAAGIRQWVANHDVVLPGWGRVVLDIAFPGIRLAIEIDGWAFHRDVDRFRRDALRQNEIVIGGWRVLRVTWYELVDDLAGFLETVRRALMIAAA